MYLPTSPNGNNAIVNSQKGFTLIEILVVIAIIGVITGITSDIFIQIIKASNKANVVTEIKQNGDSVLNQVDRLIRNAEEITSVGSKTYSGNLWAWTDTLALPATWSCGNESPTPSDVCAIIIKNPVSTGGYTKIEIHNEKDHECSSASNPLSPFTTSDMETTTGYCNGNIRLVSDAVSDNLKSSTPIGQIITNTEKRSGVSVKTTKDASNTITPFLTVRTVATKPTVITIAYTLTQGINASSRTDSQATVPFETTISLRNY